MKRFLTSSALLFLALMGTRAQAPSPDPAVFAAPPAQYQTAAWWHWMDGAIPPLQILHEYALLYPAGIAQNVTLWREGDERVVNN